MIAAVCAGVVGWDARKRPRPERIIWTGAFVVFAVAAAAEVIGSVFGWNENLARVYYLTGAVLVVGILALGELYLLLPGQMPPLAPGAALLVIAVAATTVWSAPVDATRLPEEGWRAIERGPFLVALAATINAGGTLILVAGALYSAWKFKGEDGLRPRAVGCVLIAAGAIVVALGGTLTRFGRTDLLYLAMVAGIAIIFAGVLLTRSTASAARIGNEAIQPNDDRSKFPRLIPLPHRRAEFSALATADEGIRYLVEQILVDDADAVLAACRRWSATPFVGDALMRQQAERVWALRVKLPDTARPRFDALPLAAQAQLAELYEQVWSSKGAAERHERGA